jgi:hypothetical protein
MNYLGTLRERLQDEGERVQREIVEYATLSQAAMQSTKIIAESLIHLKRPDPHSIVLRPGFETAGWTYSGGQL